MSSQTCLIRPLLINHFHLIRRDPLKALPFTPMLNQPFNTPVSSSQNFYEELSGSDCSQWLDLQCSKVKIAQKF